MMIKYLRHMMVFNTVVESGSISAGAEQLGISKSVVSQQLQTLEKALNVELLKRTTRRQVLTPAGKAFYLQCQQISDIGKQAWSDAHNTQQQAIGNISISAPHALMDSIIAPAIGRLVSLHPEITPSLYAQDQRVHLLAEQIDLAVRIGQLKDSELKQKRIGSFVDHLCVSKTYLQHQGLSIDAIQRDPSLCESLHYIANTWQGNTIRHKLTHVTDKSSCLVKQRPTRFANSVNSVLRMVQQDAGLALIPQLILAQLKEHEKNELVIITSKYQLTPEPIYALHAYSQSTPFVVQLCIQAITEAMLPSAIKY